MYVGSSAFSCAACACRTCMQAATGRVGRFWCESLPLVRERTNKSYRWLATCGGCYSSLLAAAAAAISALCAASFCPHSFAVCSGYDTHGWTCEQGWDTQTLANDCAYLRHSRGIDGGQRAVAQQAVAVNPHVRHPAQARCHVTHWHPTSGTQQQAPPPRTYQQWPCTPGAIPRCTAAKMPSPTA